MAKSSNGNGSNSKTALSADPLETLRASVAGKRAQITKLEQSRAELAAEHEALEAALRGLRVSVHVEGHAERGDELKAANARLRVLVDSLSGYDDYLDTARADLAGLEAELETLERNRQRQVLAELRAQRAQAMAAALEAIDAASAASAAALSTQTKIQRLQQQLGQPAERGRSLVGRPLEIRLKTVFEPLGFGLGHVSARDISSAQAVIASYQGETHVTD